MFDSFFCAKEILESDALDVLQPFQEYIDADVPFHEVTDLHTDFIIGLTDLDVRTVIENHAIAPPKRLQ